LKIKVYLDEDVTVSFEQALKNRSVDVVSTAEVGNKGLADIEQLNYAVKLGRVLFTHNKADFAKIHKIFISEGKKHCGIILSDQLPVGDLLRRFMKLWFKLSAKDMEDKLEFLSNWK
jgi:predicted nuclease of predicted toxin-antitoxin system